MKIREPLTEVPLASSFANVKSTLENVRNTKFASSSLWVSYPLSFITVNLMRNCGSSRDRLHWSLLLLKVYVILCFVLSVSSIQYFSDLNSDSL